jgi:hypothetical protein
MYLTHFLTRVAYLEADVANNYRFRDAHNMPVIYFGCFCQTSRDPLVRICLYLYISLCKWAPHVIPNLHPPQSPPWPHQSLQSCSPPDLAAPPPLAARSGRSVTTRSAAARSRSGRLPIWSLRPPPAPAASPSGRCAAARSFFGHRHIWPLRCRPLPLRPPPTPDLAGAAPPRARSALPMAGLARAGCIGPWPEVAGQAWPELAIVVNAS